MHLLLEGNIMNILFPIEFKPVKISFLLIPKFIHINKMSWQIKFYEDFRPFQRFSLYVAPRSQRQESVTTKRKNSSRIARLKKKVILSFNLYIFVKRIGFFFSITRVLIRLVCLYFFILAMWADNNSKLVNTKNTCVNTFVRLVLFAFVL